MSDPLALTGPVGVCRFRSRASGGERFGWRSKWRRTGRSSSWTGRWDGSSATAMACSWANPPASATATPNPPSPSDRRRTRVEPRTTDPVSATATASTTVAAVRGAGAREATLLRTVASGAAPEGLTGGGRHSGRRPALEPRRAATRRGVEDQGPEQGAAESGALGRRDARHRCDALPSAKAPLPHRRLSRSLPRLPPHPHPHPLRDPAPAPRSAVPP